MDSVQVRWITAFLDSPTGSAAPAELFWSAVCRCGYSARRGPAREFATLLPDDGDAYLRVQRTTRGPARVHLDLHVDDLEAAGAAVRAAGGTTQWLEDHWIARSPGGYVFCLVPDGGGHSRPRPTGAPRQRSLVDQICLDIAPGLFDSETAFWATLAGQPVQSGSRPEFSYLQRPAGQPLRMLFQRLEAGTGVRSHLDLACDDVPAEVDRHLGFGARVVAREQFWTVLADPLGRPYCLTGRDPGTGTLP